MSDRVEDLAAGFVAVVDSYMVERGMTRAQAFLVAGRKYPKSHAAFLASTNEKRGNVSAVAGLRREVEHG
jgi:hypothetical protein